MNALYLLKSLAPYYTVKRMFGLWYVYHIDGSYVAKCDTQRQIRNAVRAYHYGDRSHTTEGRE